MTLVTRSPSLPPPSDHNPGGDVSRRHPWAHLATGAALALLVAFHAWLLWTRLLDGGLLQPEVAARWLVGAMLTAAFVVLHRAGVSLVWGRRAVGLWLLVALLHVQSASPPGAEPSRWIAEQSVTLVWQALSAVTLAGAALLLLAGMRRRPPSSARLADVLARQANVPVRLAAGWRLQLAPRPPPVR